MRLLPVEIRGVALLPRAFVALLAVTFAMGTGGIAAANDQTPPGGTPISAPCLELLERATPTADGRDHDAGDMSGMASPAASPVATPAAALPPFDLAFIDLMLPHHKGAVAMSQVALNRAEHPELQALARQIIEVQEAEQEQLTAWRDAWYPGAPPVDMTAAMSVFDAAMAELGMPADSGSVHGMDPVAEARAMCQAEAPFDLAFIDRMTAHHQSAIVMAEVALQYAEHPDLRRFAQDVIAAQRAEIDQMLIWREQWS